MKITILQWSDVLHKYAKYKIRHILPVNEWCINAGFSIFCVKPDSAEYIERREQTPW